MKKILPNLLAVTLIFFTSCGPMVNYVGSSYGNAGRVDIDVYVDPSTVNRNYSVIGKGYLDAPVGGPFYSYGKMQRSAIRQARKHGADAILITDNVYTHAAVRTTNSFDTAGRRTNSSIVLGPEIQNRPQIHFLKYE